MTTNIRIFCNYGLILYHLGINLLLRSSATTTAVAATPPLTMIFTAILFASAASAACTRETLSSARDAFFKGKPTLAPSAKIAFNQKLQKDLSLFKDLQSFTPFNIEALDTTSCDIATFRVSDKQLLSVRLRVSNASITEVDALQAVSGDQFYMPAGFPKTTPAIFTQKQTPGTPPNIPASFTAAKGVPRADINAKTCKAGKGAARVLNRKELVYVASTYADGLYDMKSGACVLGTGKCPRIENGMQTTGDCAVATGVFGFDVRGRRWVADEETGVVLGIFYFDLSPWGTAISQILPTNLFLHEYMKVDKGGLAYIYAPMKWVPKADAQATIFT